MKEKTENLIQDFFDAVVKQEEERLQAFFMEDASIYWHNSKERFHVVEYVRANCEYPGEWLGQIKHIYEIDGVVIVISKVSTKDASMSFHVTSIFHFVNGLIQQLDEYWGDIGEAPSWRQALKIGQPWSD